MKLANDPSRRLEHHYKPGFLPRLSVAHLPAPRIRHETFKLDRLPRLLANENEPASAPANWRPGVRRPDPGSVPARQSSGQAFFLESDRPKCDSSFPIRRP